MLIPQTLCLKLRSYFQLENEGLMSNEFLNDVTSIINANRMENSHTWL